MAVVDAGGLQPKFAVAVRGAEEVEILAAKDLRERSRGEQEALARGAEPALPVGVLAAVKNSAYLLVRNGRFGRLAQIGG